MTYQTVPQLHHVVDGIQEIALQAQLETAQLLKRWPQQSLAPGRRAGYAAEGHWRQRADSTAQCQLACNAKFGL